jgi:iron complex outermembrane recepter protein
MDNPSAHQKSTRVTIPRHALAGGKHPVHKAGMALAARHRVILQPFWSVTIMFKRTKVALAAGLAAGMGLTSVPVFAQSDQRVEVTGSRIRSIAADSPSPIQVITAQEIARSGAVNIQDLLLRLPAIGSLPTFSRTNSNFDNLNSGVSTIDLRNLGEERTLVLINGKRSVAGVPGSSAVDLNSIPTDFIERIEVLTGGSSSTYGSDAVAGVINFILKRDFEGLSLDASIGESEQGDDRKEKFGITWGANAGDKGNVMLHFGYSSQGAVYSKDRDGLAIDNISDSGLTGEVGDVFKYTTPFYSSFAPQGRVFFTPAGEPRTSRTFDRAGNIIPSSPNGPNGDGVGATGFNRQEFRTIAIPTSRYTFAGKGEFELIENHRAYLEGTYVTTKTDARLEPFPLDSADGTSGLYPASGNGPAEFNVNGRILANPLIPADLLAQFTDTDGDGLRDYSFTRRLSEVGNRGSSAQTDTFRIASGAKGTLFNWDYDVYGIYGSNRRSQTASGQYNVNSFRQAMEAVPDVDDVDGDGDRAEAICRDAEARAQGCVPANVFGFNTLTPGAVAWITAPATLRTEVTQRVIGASASGEPVMLWAGPLGVAAGFEYRRESSLSEPDALYQRGLNGSNAIPITEGSFSVEEFFLEGKLPLLKDAPFAQSLGVSGAVRSSDYDTIGSTVSWNAGVEWAVNQSVKLRVTRALSTRAPNIAEMFQPPTQDFPQVTDPCVGTTAAATDAKSVACRAAPGVNENIAANNGVFKLNQADLQGTSGFDRGNPNLQEEEGRSTTVGIVFTPTGIPLLDNTTFTVDYFKIDVNDAIVATPRQFILSQCYGGDASFCQFVTRRPGAVGANSAGSLDRVDTAVSNSGGLKTEGVDVTGAWRGNVGPGRLTTRLSYTYTKEGELIPLPGSAPDPFAGEVGSPKHKATFGVGYNFGGWNVSALLSYLGKQYLDDQWVTGLCTIPLDATGECPGGAFASANSVSIPSKTYADMQVSYTWGKIEYYLGVDNLFDTKNKLCDTNASIGGENGGCSVGTGAFSGDDPIGRRYYVGLRASF